MKWLQAFGDLAEFRTLFIKTKSDVWKVNYAEVTPEKALRITQFIAVALILGSTTFCVLVACTFLGKVRGGVLPMAPIFGLHPFEFASLALAFVGVVARVIVPGVLEKKEIQKIIQLAKEGACVDAKELGGRLLVVPMTRTLAEFAMLKLPIFFSLIAVTLTRSWLAAGITISLHDDHAVEYPNKSQIRRMARTTKTPS